MKAIDTDVLSFIGSNNHKVFIIPPFQRNYEWTFEQCDELLADIISAHDKNKSHYLGNIVYYIGKSSGASSTEIVLIDGQQRVTTIVLLLCAIRDVTDDEELKSDIDSEYVKNTRSTSFRVRLKQTSYDFESFNSVVEHSPNLNEDSNIVKNYLRFIEKLKAVSIPLNEIFDTIGKLQVVDVNLQIENDLEAVQTVFEKINSTGKPLSPADLIRNFLLLSSSTSEQDRLYKEYWSVIEKTIGNEYISRFSKDYLVLKAKDDIENDKIYSRFKAKITNDNIPHEIVLAEMLQYSKFYSWLIHPEKCVDSKIQRSLKEFNTLQTDDIYPLYMYLLSELYDSNLKELRSIFNLLSDFLLRYRIVAPSSGGGALRSLVNFLLAKITDDESPMQITFDAFYFELSNSINKSSRFPDDSEFKAALMQSKKVNHRYGKVLFLKIESYGKNYIPVPIEEVTIEHLMPQTPTTWWDKNLGGKEKAAAIYEAYTNAIGNLTILSQSDNSVNSNRPWTDKVAQLKNSQFGVTSKLVQYSEWTETELKKRNAEVSDLACKIVTSPLERTRALASVSLITAWYPLSDIKTNMNSSKLQTLKYNDKEFSVTAWNQLFNEVCRICYELDNVKFDKLVLDNVIHKSTNIQGDNTKKCPVITKVSKVLVSEKKIKGTDYFSEGTLSSTRSREFSKQLLDLYGITDKFSIFVVAKDDEE